LDVLRIPCFHAIQQTHAALMRDVAGDPGVIQLVGIQHSVMATASRGLSR